MNFKQRLQTVLAFFLPFIAMGIALVLFIIGIIVVSYILLWGALIGLILFLVAYIRARFFMKKRPPQPPARSGKTYDQDDR